MNEFTRSLLRAVTYYPTFWFGLAMGLPTLGASYRLIDHAITAGADLTATGVAVGAMCAGAVSTMGVFVYRATKAPPPA